MLYKQASDNNQSKNRTERHLMQYSQQPENNNTNLKIDIWFRVTNETDPLKVQNKMIYQCNSQYTRTVAWMLKTNIVGYDSWVQINKNPWMAINNKVIDPYNWTHNSLPLAILHNKRKKVNLIVKLSPIL